VAQPNSSCPRHAFNVGAAPADPGARAANVARARAAARAERKDRPRYTHRSKVEATRHLELEISLVGILSEHHGQWGEDDVRAAADG
jgi:hypothetical protein